jgi:hypothetical protein
VKGGATSAKSAPLESASSAAATVAFNELDLRHLRVNPDWKKLPLFDRTGWKRLPFGAFAENVNERVEPADAADDIYVGLDDLDPGSLHIRRWGKGSDVIGTKLRFRKGDIIFGRRRAYQRKLAVAEFDGICSAHAMVVRAKPEVVLPGFLPFLMMSDRFMKRAVEISVGSLSPTINWKTLKVEEFDLSPLDQQRRIAEVLWAVDVSEQRTVALRNKLRAILQAQIEAELELLFEGACERLESILTDSPDSGSSAPPSAHPTGHYVLSLAALSKDGYLSNNLKPIAPTPAMLKCRLVKGDFLIDEAYREITGDLGEQDRDDLAKRAAKMAVLVKNPERIRAVVNHIVSHFQAKVEPNGFKAQVVVFDREYCVLYKAVMDELIGPEASAIVMTTMPGDPPEWKAHARDKDAEKALLDRFRDPADPLRLVIVTAKLLTGFDAPILQAMSLDKPMKDHNLLQAICRTNRTYGQEKTHGLIVDYIGIFDDVARALDFDEKTVQQVQCAHRHAGRCRSPGADHGPRIPGLTPSPSPGGRGELVEFS